MKVKMWHPGDPITSQVAMGKSFNQQMYSAPTTYWDISAKKQSKVPTYSGERGEQTKQNKNQPMENNTVWMEEGDQEVLG